MSLTENEIKAIAQEGLTKCDQLVSDIVKMRNFLNRIMEAIDSTDDVKTVSLKVSDVASEYLSLRNQLISRSQSFLTEPPAEEETV